jgi:nucleotide-binding universal stress UspA family protein
MGVAQLADIGRHVAARARFSDLVTLPQPYGAGRGAELEAVTESALFEGRTPVLVAPAGSAPAPKPRRILLGWNESSESLAAARAAMPLMRMADTVHVTVIDPPMHGPNRSDPGGLIAQYLSRHGVRTEIDVLSRSMPRVSDVLLRHVTDMDADMVVMGAYGHSRFREAIFGGATRYMLEQASVPVFMAH